jgi:transcription initiation factor TFIIB
MDPSMVFEVDDPSWGTLLLAARQGLPSSYMSHDACVPASEEHLQQQLSRCQFCNANDTHVLDGNMICQRCNTVVGRLLDQGAEWRFYGADDTRGTDPTRCCPPSNDLIPTLGCVIAHIPRSPMSSAKNNANTISRPSMVQKYQSWNALTYKERTLCAVFDALAVSAAQFGITPCILDEAKSLYKRVAETKITRGENRLAFIACSLYIACKSNKVPRSLREIAAMFNVRINAMTKGCRMFQEIVDIDLDCSQASNFVRRFCSRLGISPRGTKLTERIVQRSDDLAIVCDCTPPSVVAGAIWMANVHLDLGLSKKEVAEACIISQVTVAKCFKRLAMYEAVLVSDSEDAGCKDAGGKDAGGEDAGGEDAGCKDAGGEDAGCKDAGGEDAGGEDAGCKDAGGEDAGGECDAAC